MRRITTVILILVMVLSFIGGCSTPGELLSEANNYITHSESADLSSPGQNKDYFNDDIRRADVDFSDMNYEHYDMTKFEGYIDRIYDIARDGGDYDAFDKADNAAVNELYYINTLGEIINLQYSNNPSKEYASTECLYVDDIYFTASNEYWTAMKTLAASPSAKLMKKKYKDWQISWFENYESDTGEEIDLFEREKELEQEYYTLESAEAKDAEAIGKVFVELVGIRNKEAQLMGYDSYAEYAYSELTVRDYSPSDSMVIWQTAKEYFVPIIQQYADSVYSRSNELYYSDDIDCSPRAIIKGMDECLPKISPELFDAFLYMRDYGLYNIAASDTKIDTGYTTDFYYYNEPYIINCPEGSYYDYTSMFHEFGHFANMYYVPKDLVFGSADNDLSELQSQGMEIIFMNYYDELFGAENGNAVRADVLLNLLYSIVDGAMYDEFQQKVYAEKNLTPERVNEIYSEIYASYGYKPYSGSETVWMDIEHNFTFPFYYISYSTSAISALEIYAKSISSYDDAVDVYLKVEAMDEETMYLSDVLKSVGLGDVFNTATSAEVASAVKSCFKEF